MKVSIKEFYKFLIKLKENIGGNKIKPFSNSDIRLKIKIII